MTSNIIDILRKNEHSSYKNAEINNGRTKKEVAIFDNCIIHETEFPQKIVVFNGGVIKNDIKCKGDVYLINVRERDDHIILADGNIIEE